MRNILGISAFYHDSAASLIIDGEIVAAAQEERFTREKHTAVFPVNAIRYCLEYGGCSLNDLDAVVFYDKPLLKFERLLETYYEFAPGGFFSFCRAIPGWIKEKLFLKKAVFDGLSEVGYLDKHKIRLLFTEHHLSHAASAFYPSAFGEAAILTVDGVGEWATASISMGQGSSIKMIKEMRFPHSAGLLYSAFTYFLGFRVNSGEYKLMGLAPYGNPDADETAMFISLIKKHLVSIKNDGSVWLNQSYFGYSTSLKMIREKKWEKLFGFPNRKPDDPITETHCNLAFAIQHITEEIILKMAKEASRITGSSNLCLAGGVALNCVANGKLRDENIFKEIYVQPAAGDAGGAIGASLAAYHLYFGEKRVATETRDLMKGTFLGPDFSEQEVVHVLKRFKAVFRNNRAYDDLCGETAALLSEGKVVGWFRGRMELGARALGNRSILADARNREMQKRLNLKVKFREGFRPFAPAVMEEDTHLYFNQVKPSPYMLFNAQVNEERRKTLPSDYNSMDFWDKLYCERSDIQAVTHLDFSARIQTVGKDMNHDFWTLLNAFKRLTGYGLLINTSFNVRGEPIVCSPEDAYRCFMGTDMDYLVLNNFILKKEDQPDHDNRERWMKRFKPD